MTIEDFKTYVKTRKPLDTEEIHRFMDEMSNEARRVTFRLNAAYYTPDEVRGQVVKASIVLVKGTEPTNALKKEIQDYVKHRTAPYKYPRIVEYVDALPKTVNGKIRRVAIRQKDGADLKAPKLPEGLL